MDALKAGNLSDGAILHAAGRLFGPAYHLLLFTLVPPGYLR